MTNVYDVGDVARVSTTTVFTDIDGDPFDPNEVVFRYKPPGASVVTKTYGTDSEVVKDGVGDYHIDIPLTASGDWYYRVEGKDGAGDPLGADEGRLSVSKSEVV